AILQPNRKALWAAHGIFMCLAWFVFFPTGILTARFGRRLSHPRAKCAIWFVVHWVMQTLGLAATLLAFGISLSMVPAGEHMQQPHHLLGLVLVLLCGLQVVLGILRPALPSSPGEPVTCQRRGWSMCHKTMGYTLFLVGVCNVFLGLLRASAHGVLFGVVTCVVVVLIGTFAALFVIKRQNEQLAAQKVVAEANAAAAAAARLIKSAQLPRKPLPPADQAVLFSPGTRRRREAERAVQVDTLIHNVDYATGSVLVTYHMTAQDTQPAPHERVFFTQSKP
ncbi:hypothetical protein EON66_02580, partial [archaeon]